jgi:hypothetical protein
VCTHGSSYRRDRLEAAFIARLREATTLAMVETLTRMVNGQIEAAIRARDARGDEIKAEILQLEQEAGNLVRALARGLESPTVREGLRVTEAALAALRVDFAQLEQARQATPQVHPAWIRAKLDRLDKLLQQEPVRARIEIQKHLDGDLTMSPVSSVAGERRAVVTGRVKANSLLANDQEAVCLSVVAGAGFEPATFGL